MKVLTIGGLDTAEIDLLAALDLYATGVSVLSMRLIYLSLLPIAALLIAAVSGCGGDPAPVATASAFPESVAEGSLAGCWTELQSGFAAFVAGDYEAAARSWEQALRGLDALPLEREERQSFRIGLSGVLALAYDALGQAERAEELLASAAEDARESGSESLAALAELMVTAFEIQHGEAADAEELGAAIDRFERRFGDRLSSHERQLFQLLRLVFSTQASWNGQSGKPPLPFAAIAGLGDEPSMQALGLLRVGQQHFQERRFLEALGHFQEARAAFAELGLRDLELGALILEAGAHAQLFDVSGWPQAAHFEAALALSLEAADRYDQMLVTIEVDHLLAGFAGQRQGVLEMAMALLAVAGRPAEAFGMAERARARSFLRLLGNERPALAPGVDPLLVTEIEQVRRKLEALERLPLPPDPAERDLLGELRATSRRRHEALLTSIKLANPEYASFLHVEAIPLAILRREALRDETSLVAYYTFENRVLAWVVDREHGSLQALELDPAGGSLASRIDYLLDLIRSREAGPELLRASTELHRLLITPLLPRIRHRRVIVVPHGPLHSLPFAALRDPQSGRALVEDLTLSYAPSASVLWLLRRKVTPSGGRALVLGDPATAAGRLPAAAHEARRLAELFGTRPLIGAEASETAVRACAGSIDLLHLAAHGVFDPKAPRFSHLALSAGGGHDGRLSVGEVFDEVDLRGVDLVVLSACDSALGERTRGDELTGLTRAFHYAGSPTVVASLWKVDDRSSERLMRAFYRRWLEGAPAAEALRAAQLELIADAHLAGPFHWAAFTLSGLPDVTWSPAEGGSGGDLGDLGCRPSPGR